MLEYRIEHKTLHFKQPAGTSRGTYRTREIRLLHVMDTETGLKGVGECSPLPDLGCDRIERYDETLIDFCRLTAFTHELDTESMRPYPSMTFGLETAMLNYKRQSWKLFDTPFGNGEESIPINGLVWMGNAEEMETRMSEKVKDGFRCIKLKIGAIQWEEELALIQALRKKFPADQLQIRVDANGGFTPEQAPYILEALAPYHIHSIEQPIAKAQWRKMADLCRNSPIPIALDEELIGLNYEGDKTTLLDAIMPQYLVLKPTLHGGMCGTTEWIRLANERHIGTWITSALESNVGLNALAHFAAKTYGPHLQFHQGLGTGELFTDNITTPLYRKGQDLCFSANF